MMTIKKTLALLVASLMLISCSNQEVVVQKYTNGKAKVKYKILKGTAQEPVDFLFQAFYENGTLMKEGLIRNKKEEGEWKYYFEDGKLSSVGYYENGVRKGKYTRYYDTGEVEQEGDYADGKIIKTKYFFRNGAVKPDNYSVISVIKPACKLWTEEQKQKVKKRCGQSMQFDFSNSFFFCDCAVDSASRHVDFNTIDTLTDFERNAIFLSIIQNGPCAGQYW